MKENRRITPSQDFWTKIILCGLLQGESYLQDSSPFLSPFILLFMIRLFQFSIITNRWQKRHMTSVYCVRASLEFICICYWWETVWMFDRTQQWFLFSLPHFFFFWGGGGDCCKLCSFKMIQIKRGILAEISSFISSNIYLYTKSRTLGKI